VVIAAWAMLGYFGPTWFYKDVPGTPSAQGTRGTLGDQFGAVNALFTGLAFAGVIAALLMQHKDTREAGRQHEEALALQRQQLSLQLVINMLDDIRSQEWGDAHTALADWQRAHPADFAEVFGRERRKADSPSATIDRHRRVFIKPFHKMWRLVQVGVVDDRVAMAIVSEVYVHSLLNIVEPLERAIRANYDVSGFRWVESLFTKEELEREGTFATPTVGP